MIPIKYASHPLSKDSPISVGTRVAAAAGWDRNNREHPKLRGTVVHRKRETERWVSVQFDESYCGSMKPSLIPVCALVEILEEDDGLPNVKDQPAGALPDRQA
jgi:hypothetical protein